MRSKILDYVDFERADAYGAMTGERSYRTAITQREAIIELKR